MGRAAKKKREEPQKWEEPRQEGKPGGLRDFHAWGQPSRPSPGTVRPCSLPGDGSWRGDKSPRGRSSALPVPSRRVHGALPIGQRVVGNGRRDLGGRKRGRVGGVGGEVEPLLFNAVLDGLGGRDLLPELLEVRGAHGLGGRTGENRAISGRGTEDGNTHVLGSLRTRQDPPQPRRGAVTTVKPQTFGLGEATKPAPLLGTAPGLAAAPTPRRFSGEKAAAAGASPGAPPAPCLTLGKGLQGHGALAGREAHQPLALQV